MNRRSTSVAANPVLIGAATVLVVIVAVFLAYNANNGLPFVPTYNVWLAAAERVEPRHRQRGADRRRPRRDHRQDRAADAQRRQRHGETAREAGDERQAAAGRLDRDRAPALDARPEVRRGHARQLVERGPRGRDAAAQKRDAETGRVRRLLQHVRRADARGEPGQPARVRRRARRAAARASTRRSSRSTRSRRTRSRC